MRVPFFLLSCCLGSLLWGGKKTGNDTYAIKPLSFLLCWGLWEQWPLLLNEGPKTREVGLPIIALLTPFVLLSGNNLQATLLRCTYEVQMGWDITEKNKTIYLPHMIKSWGARNFCGRLVTCHPRRASRTTVHICHLNLSWSFQMQLQISQSLVRVRLFTRLLGDRVASIWDVVLSVHLHYQFLLPMNK